MVENLSQGRIYKGSNAEVSVEVFPRYYVASAVTDIVLNFYTNDKETSIEFSGSGITMYNNIGTVLFQPIQLEALEDGVLRYIAEYKLEGLQQTTDNETRLYIKTPQPYTPIDYVTQDEVQELVDEAISASTAMTGMIAAAMAVETARTEATYLKTHQSLSGYAKESYVNEKIAQETARTESTYLKTHQSLDNYATKQWVEDKNYLTQHQDISGKQDKLTAGEGIQISGNTISCTVSGGTGGVTTGQVQTMIETAMVAETARTESTYLKTHQSLANYYTSGQTNSAIATAVQDKISSSTITTVWTGTQAQYDAIPTKLNNVLYFING